MRKIFIIYFMFILLFNGCSSSNPFINNHMKQIQDENIFVYKSIAIDNSKKTRTVILYYDGGIVLRIDDSETTIVEGSQVDDIEVLKSKYSLYEMEADRIAVVFREQGSRRGYIKIDLYSYKQEKLIKVFDSDEIKAKITSLDNKSIDLSIPYLSEIYTIQFSKEESFMWSQREVELEKNGIFIDNNFITEIQDNIILNPYDFLVKDIDEDGKNDLLIIAEIYSVGAKTPHVQDRVLIEFEILPELIKYKSIIFERDHVIEEFPFADYS